jgi:hypothetical protein
VRRIVRVNSSREIVVESSGLPTRPFTGPEGQDPFWTTGIFRRDLFGSGAGVDITVTPELPETSDTDAIPFTTAYYFPGSDTQPVDHILTIPLQMAHYTMVPDTMNIHTGNTVASQSPIGTPRPTPSLPPRYNPLNASIPIPTQGPSRVSRVFPPPEHHVVAGFILTLPHVPSRGSYPPFPGGAGPSGITQSFTPTYQIPVGGQTPTWRSNPHWNLTPIWRSNPIWDTTPSWRTTPTYPTLWTEHTYGLDPVLELSYPR